MKEQQCNDHPEVNYHYREREKDNFREKMPASHMTHFRVQQRGYKFQDWHPKNSLRGKIHNISDSTINQSKPKSE